MFGSDSCDVTAYDSQLFRREDIEYPVAGGGIYSTSSDYTKLLQELLRLFRTPEDAYPKAALLSRQSVQSLFKGSLPESAKGALAHVMNMRPPQPDDVAAVGEWDWSTAMVVWNPADGRRLGTDAAAEEGGWGRRKGSVGWFGAAGTMYFIDPESNLTVSHRTCALPPCR
jgi:CubicO group peptidase (beta-lactamase class C family)